jgi:fructose-1,6-bisphosphatase/inositol monophosphatase family enzyme
MKILDIDHIDQIIREVAASEIMPRFRMLAADKIMRKADDSFVTEADQQAERALIARFKDYVPGCNVVGEEGFAEDPGIFSHFERDGDVVVIDPIDGTSNFVSGTPQFGVMVAWMRGYETILSLIHDPNSGDTLMAEKGGGVRLKSAQGNCAMRLASHDAETARIGIAGSRLKKIMRQSGVAEIIAKLPPLETGSAAAFDYARLFTGDRLFSGSAASRASFLLYRQSKPWDHMPGLLMVSEAGGYAATLAGKPYQAGAADGGLFVAPDQKSWEAFHATIAPVLADIAPQ